MDVVARFIRSASGEAGDVIANDCLEVARLFSRLDHLGERIAASGASARQRIIDIPAIDFIAVVGCPFRYIRLLVGDRAFLQVGASASVANGGDHLSFCHVFIPACFDS